MAGTLPIALTQQFDINGKPLAGAMLYFFQIGTLATPQNSFQDFGLSLVNPNPLPTDQYGRVPMFYLADGQVHARLTDSRGVVIFDYPTMQVIGPSSGSSGGGSSVDPSTIMATGDIKFRPTSETITGWVKLNSQTIGSPTSGATQRANADTQSLYIYLWNNFTDAHCPVAGGRGATGLADFTSNKTISLPDWRGKGPMGLDDMGYTSAGIILSSNVTSGGGDGPTTPSAYGGEANHTLVVAEAPAGQITLNDPGHAHSVAFVLDSTAPGSSETVKPYGYSGSGNYITSNVTTGASLTDHGGGGSHNNMSPFTLGTWFMKL